ncbi:unnamed protein product [Discosporangium mesarthrocarpum]
MAEVGIYDDLAPTLIQDNAVDFGGSSSSTSCRDGNAQRGLVISAQKRWIVCTHPGVRRLTISREGSVAVSGILDRAALYTLCPRLAGWDVDRAGKTVDVLEGIDRGAPTTISVVWMCDSDAQQGAPHGDGKAIPLPKPIFRAIFGAELALSSPLPPSQSGSDSSSPAAVLVGDLSGVVRWCPLTRCKGVVGGTLAALGEPILSVLPLTHPLAGVVGLLVVGAAGAVLQLTVSRPDGAPPSKAGSSLESDNTLLPSDTMQTMLRRLPFPVDSACSVPGFLVHCHAGAAFASPLPNGYRDSDDELLHEIGSGRPFERGGTWGYRRDGVRIPSSQTTTLLPVRLPLSNTVSVASTQILAEESRPDPIRGSKTVPYLGPTKGSAQADSQDTSMGVVAGAGAGSRPTSPASTTGTGEEEKPGLVCTMVVALSSKGRIIGFRAPRTVEELEGWALDSGKGGVRVGGSVGAERRVKGQLERLSAIGSRCDALSLESARRDEEIRCLRDASIMIPELLELRQHLQGLGTGQGDQRCGQGHEQGGGRGGVDRAGKARGIRHSVSMNPDTEAGDGLGLGWPMGAGRIGAGVGPGQELRVRVTTRLWLPAGAPPGPLSHCPEGEHREGRWFLSTVLIAGSGDPGEGEGQAWSSCTPIPLTALQRPGACWVSSWVVPLASPQPVRVTSWLQLRFGGAPEPSTTAPMNAPAATTTKDPALLPLPIAEGEKRNTTELSGLCAAEGLCMELGSQHFDLLDWGVPVWPLPVSDAAVRGAAWGRGECFCGPNMAIADIFGARAQDVGANSLGQPALGKVRQPQGPRMPHRGQKPPPRPFSVPWGSDRLRLVCLGVDAETALPLLLSVGGYGQGYGDMPGFDASKNGNAGDRAWAGAGAGEGSGGDARDRVAWGRGSSEFAVRVAGQVALVRASDSLAVGVSSSASRVGEEAGVRAIDICISCSHEAMLPLLREALLRRALAKSSAFRSTEGRFQLGLREANGVAGSAASRLARGLHPIADALSVAGDAVHGLVVSREREGVTPAQGREALALMGRVGEIYKGLRSQQEAWPVL